MRNVFIFMYLQKDDEDICVICHDGLSVEATKQMDCGHVFHAGVSYIFTIMHLICH